jgi:hypothetical protein
VVDRGALRDAFQDGRLHERAGAAATDQHLGAVAKSCPADLWKRFATFRASVTRPFEASSSPIGP